VLGTEGDGGERRAEIIILSSSSGSDEDENGLRARMAPPAHRSTGEADDEGGHPPAPATPARAPPTREQIGFDGACADVWALGATLLEVHVRNVM